MESSPDILAAQDGAFESLFNLAFWNDVQTCYKYNMVLFWNGIDTAKYFVTDPYLSIESAGLMVHKSPIVLEECLRLFSDIEYLDEFFDMSDDFTNMNVWTHLIENVMYNMGDMVKNLIEAKENLDKLSYHAYGVNLG